MSDDIPVIPEEVPEFTGNLELLDQNIAGVRSAGTSLKDSGSAIHTRFGGLSAYYKAPEAEALFATTAPVAAKGEEFATELETVASALDTYAAAVGPLKQKFDQLRQDAIAFRAKIEGDDEWRADGDLVEENNNRRSDINAAYAAFQAAERDCYNKIVALVGGEALVVNDGSNKENMYGYRGEDLNNAGGLPWGDPVEESNPWYYVHEHVWDFAVGFVVDGVWGTIKGLGTLVGFNGWDAAGQAWVGLGKLATGIVIMSNPVTAAAFWLTPDDKLPSWIRDSRTAVVETGKALIAYDEWGKNPARAAGAVTFNVVTTIFTGGAGGAVSGAGKAGAIAKAISFAGKAGRIVDPMTYITKGVGATAVKISDVMASLRGITDGTHIKLGEGTYQIADAPNITDDLPAGLTPENSVRMETPKGEVVYLDTQTLVVHNADGTVRESLDGIKHEGTAAERGVDVSRPQPELVGAGAKVGDGGTAVGRVGDDGLPGGRTDNLPGGRGDNLPGGRADDLGRGPAGSHETPGSGGRGETPGGGPTETPAGGGHRETPGGSGTDGPGSGGTESPGGGDGPGGGPPQDPPGGGTGAADDGANDPGGWERQDGDPQPFERGGQLEDRVRQEMRGTKVKPGDLERVLDNLAGHPAGREVAETIASGRFDGATGFDQTVSSLAHADKMSGGIEQLRLGNRLYESGVRDISFEVKGGFDIKPGVRTGEGTDLDVMARDAAGNVHGYQFKDVANPKRTVKKIFDNMQQLAQSGADFKTFVVDTKGTMADHAAMRTAQRLTEVYGKTNVQFIIRVEDGVMRIPPDGTFMPEAAL
ncbi:hypothetical protein [Streptomyces europaeiscabiei]|uniref:Tox-REase-7 domain-containing protein n=1 Tax=Streptomyces europaeiscabiei TaxID=146819 RepID=A0ABU4NEJ3_9ACTN|nr:hypothetical protein [Streptomyces europaeiscabiei]MDX2774665.1 hypothetical protein [Streptomyces europaeiscabiei]MDX3541693.1 hypothetical protein [Streptomyces europaeiscabiei]MDX3552034.1 hypothetical protein [Streptomyces europaeiscabiei]MDX3700273.1 hypothetical protein [Streptomyces europaeiscabiei]MDX3782963.1 hypothetical protein [Streptomyces europaeiscabiei]